MVACSRCKINHNFGVSQKLFLVHAKWTCVTFEYDIELHANMINIFYSISNWNSCLNKDGQLFIQIPSSPYNFTLLPAFIWNFLVLRTLLNSFIFSKIPAQHHPHTHYTTTKTITQHWLNLKLIGTTHFHPLLPDTGTTIYIKTMHCFQQFSSHSIDFLVDQSYHKHFRNP